MCGSYLTGVLIGRLASLMLGHLLVSFFLGTIKPRWIYFFLPLDFLGVRFEAAAVVFFKADRVAEAAEDRRVVVGREVVVDREVAVGRVVVVGRVAVVRGALTGLVALKGKRGPLNCAPVRGVDTGLAAFARASACICSTLG